MGTVVGLGNLTIVGVEKRTSSEILISYPSGVMKGTSTDGVITVANGTGLTSREDGKSDLTHKMKPQAGVTMLKPLAKDFPTN